MSVQHIDQRTNAESVLSRLRVTEGSGLRTFSDPEPFVWARTQGTSIWDEDGREYLDLYAGFAVASVGYCHPRVTEAIVEQARRLTHAPSAYPTSLRADFYERLIDIAPAGLSRALVAVTGAMANEMAVQLARAATGRQAIVSFSGTYIGRSVGSVGFAGKSAYRQQLGVPAEPQFLPYPDPYRSPWAGTGEVGDHTIALLEQMIDDPASGLDPLAAIVFEPIQGNGGVVIPPDGFLRELRRLADRAGALLIFDEIQCGFGRSGKVWACDYDGVAPDLMTVGKGIGGGMALAAILGTENVMTTWKPDAITSTFLANNLNIAAGVATLDVFREEDLISRSAELGATALSFLRRELSHHDQVGDVRGRGLFIGVEIVKDRVTHTPDPAAASAAVRALRSRGVVVGQGGRYGNVIKVSPALIIEEANLRRGLMTLVEILS
jgi:4-aminobutyrate aminotransferase / (S)-3-amino-2-methylpropionate transaminase / 5-aminovalerate transaminase